MKTRIIVLGISLFAVLSFTSCASLLEITEHIGRQCLDASYSNEPLLNNENRAYVDAWTNGGITGKTLVSLDATVSLFEKISGKDHTAAHDILKSSINDYVADSEVATHGEKRNAVAASFVVVANFAGHVEEKHRSEMNDLFFEENAEYMDPGSPNYDPYFMERIEVDRNGLYRFRPTDEAIRAIRDKITQESPTNWDRVMNEVVDEYYMSFASEEEREKFIRDNYDEISQLTRTRIGQIRQQIATDYLAEKLSTTDSSDNICKVDNDAKFAGATDSESSYNDSVSAKTALQNAENTSNSTSPKTPEGTLRQISGYAFDAITLTDAQKVELDEVIETLYAHSNITVHIIGHTCNIGADDVNRSRGLQRAEIAKKYLIQKGVASERIEIETKGATSPLAPNNSIENRQKNRRIEVQYK